MKTHLLLLIALVLLTSSLFSQNNKASVMLTAAIYQEEVSGNLDKAVELYLDILKKYPDDRQVAAKTLYRLGLVNEKMGKLKADEYFTRLVNTYPDQTEMVALAKAKLTRLNRSTLESTMKAEQSFKLAADLFKQFNYESAVAEYEKVIKLTPKSRLAHEAQLWIGQCYLKEGKNDQALKSFYKIIKEYPESTIIPVAELMISQVKQANAKEPKMRKTIVLDDKTILDTVTGIKFTKINTWAGKNDVITSASSIIDISPNRKFLLADNRIIPFDNTGSFALFDTLSFGRVIRLSPDGTQIANFGTDGISIIPVSPETGRPTGEARKLRNDQYKYGGDLNWSPNGENLVLSLQGEDERFSLWSLSVKVGTLKQLTNSVPYGFFYPAFSKNGSNIIYKSGNLININNVRIKPQTGGNSVSLSDFLMFYKDRFFLSPDNKWIFIDKVSKNKFLFRLVDKQIRELSTPYEVGGFVSWADESSKAIFYCPSYEEKNMIKIASVFGGPAFELGTQFSEYSFGWTPDSKGLIVAEKGADVNKSFKMINLANQELKNIDGIENPGENPSFSPDCSKILVGLKLSGPMDLSVLPVSLKDFRITGKPSLIFKGFIGTLRDFSWSADSKKIAFCHGRELWICSAEGGTPLQLTKTPIIVNNPLWSPIGDAIAVINKSKHELLIISAYDGKVLHSFRNVDNYSWTPNGKEITVGFIDGQLNTISLVSGKTKIITNFKESTHLTGLNSIKWSSDGKWIAINGYDESIIIEDRTFLINSMNGKIIEFESYDPDNQKNINWSPDSKWISFSSLGIRKIRLEGTLWEADLTGFMNKINPGTPIGYATDLDIRKVTESYKVVGPDSTFTDSRDGHVYGYKKIGNQTWMTENLAYLPEVSPDSAFSATERRYYVYGYSGKDVKEAKNTENFKKYGVLYNWPATSNGATGSNSVPSGVRGISPSGWHLPSNEEWVILERTLGISKDEVLNESNALRSSGSVVKKLLSPLAWEDWDICKGQSGFNALPGGGIGPVSINKKGLYIVGLKEQSASFWTSSPSRPEGQIFGRTISDNSIYLSPFFSAENCMSIRCIKD